MSCNICDRKSKLFKQKFGSMLCSNCNDTYTNVLDAKLLEGNHDCMKISFEKEYIKTQKEAFSPVTLVKSYMKKLKTAMQHTKLDIDHPDYIEGHFIIVNYHNGYLDPEGLWSLDDPLDRDYWITHLDTIIKRLTNH